MKKFTLSLIMIFVFIFLSCEDEYNDKIFDPDGKGGNQGNNDIVCTYDGVDYKPGDRFEATDGCNSCICDEKGMVACTELGCNNCTEDIYRTCEDGTKYVEAYCDNGMLAIVDYLTDPCEDSTLTCKTGEQKYEKCEDGREFIVAECDENGEWFYYQTLVDPCESDAVCLHNKNAYKAGDTFPADDGCNKCVCEEDGNISCTEMACEKDKIYKGDPEECKVIKFTCEDGWKYFSDEKGCGCMKDEEPMCTEDIYRTCENGTKYLEGECHDGMLAIIDYIKDPCEEEPMCTEDIYRTCENGTKYLEGECHDGMLAIIDYIKDPCEEEPMCTEDIYGTCENGTKYIEAYCHDGMLAMVDYFTDPCEEEPVCKYNGQLYRAGESFPANDGCNTCSCSENGMVACTKMACNFCTEDIYGTCEDGKKFIEAECIEGHLAYVDYFQDPCN